MPGPVERLLDTARRVETSFDAAGRPSRLVWHIWGDGPPITLLHGGAGSWRHWVRNVAPLLAAGRQVLAPDLPGLGESDKPPSPYAPATVADIVATGLRELLPDTSFDLVGFSFGAIAAGTIAARHRALIRSLTLVGAGALGVQRARIVLQSVRDKTGPDRQDANRANLLQLMIADPANIDALALAIQDWNATRTRVSSVSIASSTLLLDALREINCPLAAIWGEHDQAAGAALPERVAALRALRPGLPIEIIPAAGHWVSYEAADAFNAALARILAQHDV